MKLAKLTKLRQEIIEKYYAHKWKEVWFFPADNGVKGFLGTQDILFVGLNPSLGHFPSKYDKIFYKSLKKNGFENAHLTDLVKLRASNDVINQLLGNQTTLREQKEFLAREIQIIKPKVIVTMGKKCDEHFRKLGFSAGSNVFEIRHYTSLRYPKTRKGVSTKELFSEEMREVRRFYLKTAKMRRASYKG